MGVDRHINNCALTKKKKHGNRMSRPDALYQRAGQTESRRCLWFNETAQTFPQDTLGQKHNQVSEPCQSTTCCAPLSQWNKDKKSIFTVLCVSLCVCYSRCQWTLRKCETGVPASVRNKVDMAALGSDKQCQCCMLKCGRKNGWKIIKR